MRIQRPVSMQPAPAVRPRPENVAARRAPAGYSGVSSFEGASTKADPNALALVGLKRGSGTPAQIKQLQDDLVSMGFLDASVRSNVGYGNTFGPMTESAVKQLQAAFNLAQSGAIDAATAKILLNGGAVQVPPAPPPTPGPQFPGAPPADPSAAALQGLQAGAGSADGARIKQLQDDLVRMGYLDPSITSNTGYGKSFGPLTQAALAQFQDDNGLPQSGQIDAATTGALLSPRPRPAGIAVGAAHAYRDQLGLATGPLQTLADGTQRQTFDRGAVLFTPDGLLHVVDTSGAAIVPPQRLGVAGSVDQANQSFLSQWGPTAWNSAPGAPYGYNDCGPTSCAMVLSALGLIPHPGPGDAEKVIDQMRDAALGHNTTTSQDTNDPELERALRASGAQCSVVKATLANVDSALASGHPLIVGSSRTWQAWGHDQSAAGGYLNHRDPGGHYVTVLGKAADGNYIVGDPLSRTGAKEVSAAQLQTMLGGAWSAIEVSRP